MLEALKPETLGQVPEGYYLPAAAAVCLLAFGHIRTPDEERGALDGHNAFIGPPWPPWLHAGVIAWDRATDALFKAHDDGKLTLVGQRDRVGSGVGPEADADADLPRFLVANEMVLTQQSIVFGKQRAPSEFLGKQRAPSEFWRGVKVKRTEFVAAFSAPPVCPADASTDMRLDWSLLIEMKSRVESGTSKWSAAQQVADRAAGGATLDSKIRRLIRHYDEAFSAEQAQISVPLR